MKTLYVNLNNKQIQSTESIEVLNYNLLDDFFYYLGEAIAKNADYHANKILLIEDFNTPENTLNFDEILKQWEELKLVLFGESPKGIFKVTIPKGYIDWLHYNKNDAYRNIYTILFTKNKSNVVNIDVEDFYTSCIKGTLMQKIESFVKKANLI